MRCCVDPSPSWALCPGGAWLQPALLSSTNTFFPVIFFFLLAHERNATVPFPPLSGGKTLTASEVFTGTIPPRRLIGSADSARPASLSFDCGTGPYVPSPSFSTQRNSEKVTELLALLALTEGGRRDRRAESLSSGFCSCLALMLTRLQGLNKPGTTQNPMRS